MKKLVLTIVSILLALAGCASSGGGGDLAPFKVDLSQMTIIPHTVEWEKTGKDLLEFDQAYPGTRNAVPFASQWRWAAATLGELPANITEYQRVTIRIKCFNADGEELPGADGQAQVGMFYDMSQRNANGELHTDGNPNLILKEMNVGGFSGLVSTDRGVRVRMKQPPAGMWIQAASNNVKFIEITEVVFHNGNYESK